ncbi:MAG: alpha-L-fucosidase [Kribbellaceae bacterium]|nr:alpha-L-fucosidase [Kribbellaceae bacterium]
MLKFLLRFAVVVVVLVLVFVGCSAVWTWQDNRKADMTTNGPYQPTQESLNKHPLPQWFADAKFGIMIHWGLYSVPGFAPKGTTFSKLLETQYGREHYGDAPYSDFTKQFEAGLKHWDPNRWATQFKTAGASYVVVTAKYADGYSLWPTQVRNPHAPDFHATRDLMGELAAAVRKQGLKFGVYYSGGVDWTFQRKTVKTLGDYAYLHYGEDYREYATAQVRELITRYKPDILWNDISWPTGSKRLYALLADYYNTVPEGVVDDRWSTASFGRQVMSLGPARWGFDQLMKGLFKLPGVADGVNTQKPAKHSDFRTPEYTDFDTVQDKFWQQDRGIGGSFGYNREETDQDYTKSTDLIAALARAAANNGALLLNVGPSGGAGEIVPEQLSRLTDIGAWLKVNREALDGTRPWRQSTAITAAGDRVMFTQKDKTVYAVVLGRPKGDIVIKDVVLTGRAQRLGAGPVTLSGNVLKAAGDGSYAPVFKIG